MTGVNKCLRRMSKIVAAGNTVAFDGDGSYIQSKVSGQVIPMEERGGMYVLKMWVARDPSSPF